MPITETVTRTLYTFDELSDDAKAKALNSLWELNVHYDWWDSVYEDASRVHLSINGFECGHRQTISIKFELYPIDTAKAILQEHGQGCDTYKLAAKFIADRLVIAKEWQAEQNQSKDESDHIADCDLEEAFKWDYPGSLDLEELEEGFLRDLGSEYLRVLQGEYDYRTSEDAVRESILANEYLFTDDGRLA